MDAHLAILTIFDEYADAAQPDAKPIIESLKNDYIIRTNPFDTFKLDLPSGGKRKGNQTKYKKINKNRKRTKRRTMKIF